MALLSDQVLGNPHSVNPTSGASTTLVEAVRGRGAPIFFHGHRGISRRSSPPTPAAGSNWSGSPTLWARGSLPADVRQPQLGQRHPRICACPRGGHIYPWRCRRCGSTNAAARRPGTARPGRNNLFAYPAQSNFSAVQHPLDWIERAHAKGWDVLLDAAAFARRTAWICRLETRFRAALVLQDFRLSHRGGLPGRPPRGARQITTAMVAGGTITVASVQGEKHYLADGTAGFEDGTVDYLNIPAVGSGCGTSKRRDSRRSRSASVA